MPTRICKRYFINAQHNDEHAKPVYSFLSLSTGLAIGVLSEAVAVFVAVSSALWNLTLTILRIRLTRRVW